MGNRQSRTPSADSQSSDTSKRSQKRRKQKKHKKKDFQIIADHRPPGYTETKTDVPSGLHSDRLRRQLEEMEAEGLAAATTATAMARSNGDELPTYGRVAKGK
ncbi:hypothetical protein IAU59_001854 [Kwoniella sp. CBS 9459]